MAHHEIEKQPNHLAMSKNEYEHHKSDVWKTTVLLSIVTIVEVVFAILYEKYLIPKGWSLGILRLFLIVMSLVKAGYIMAVFMHLKHESKAFMVTILVPFTLLIWMIISFLMDGESWNHYNKERFGSKPDITVQHDHGGIVNHH